LCLFICHLPLMRTPVSAKPLRLIGIVFAVAA